MNQYNPKKIEKKWQRYWEKNKLDQAKDFSKKPKYYCLVEFPYPSGDGLHVGHTRSNTAMDIIARKRRMQGYNVLYPMGWDAFGLPTENYAIKKGIHPKIVTKKNTDIFRKQLKSLAFSFDWSREINTTDPKYYKWTQWIFLQLYKKGLAYKHKMPINWCLSCKVGLANEEVVDGKCERCGGQTEKKEKEQWMLAITKYADRLDKDLDKVDYLEKIKIQQKNWIGKSEGAEIQFSILNFQFSIQVFTTRVDTIFGCTYVVIAPEHQIISNLKSQISNLGEVEKYIQEAKRKSDLQRTELQKEKTGVELKGIKAVNPFNNEEVPVFVADYVLGHYGTGAVMAVPAHDERDFEFAKKYGLSIKQSVALNQENFNKTLKTLEALSKIFTETEKEGVKFWLLGGLACAFYSRIVYRDHSDLDLIVKTKEDQIKFIKILEKLEYKTIGNKKLTEKLDNCIYKNDDGIEIDIGSYIGEFGLLDKDFEDEVKLLNGFKSRVLSFRFVKSFKEMQLKERNKEKDRIDYDYLSGKVFTDDGILVDSGQFTGLTSAEARGKMAKWLEENKFGKKVVKFHLRDWVFSRQHYWGEPIPIINCQKCGLVLVPEKDLPVELPNVKKYEPTDTGESPLAAISKWVNVKCPKCKGPAKRETDTMPNWAGSSWYYLAYLMRGISNFQFPISKYKKVLKYWMPVDWYNGGMEHTTLHLLYSRFWNKFLYDIKAVPTSEPYKKRTSHGMILGPDGEKMSKSRGNIINPDDIVSAYGADAYRLYQMFMGPFDQAIPWDPKGIEGTSRFLGRVWKLQSAISHQLSAKDQKLKAESGKLETLLHKTIKKVSEDIESMRFNTAVSSLMILSNEFEKQEKIHVSDYALLVTLLSPFAPHICEEIWQSLGYKKSIFLEKWPKFDPQKIREEAFELVVQINGKVRDKFEAPTGISENEARLLTLKRENVKKWIGNKQVKKVIFIKNKLINLII